MNRPDEATRLLKLLKAICGPKIVTPRIEALAAKIARQA
jgi:hypothetical protein